MLNNHGFDLWADNYDRSVNAADENILYPFAGYRELLNIIYGTVMSKKPVSVLDIGIGTGTLAYKLYEGGNQITGIDFSNVMLEKARSRMPGAVLIEFDFSKGLPKEVQAVKYDFVISTYALHHLSDTEKVSFIRFVLNIIRDSGMIIIGDVSFQNRDDLEKCRASCDDEWDDDEYYFVFSELHEALRNECSLTYQQISHCAGLLEILPITQKHEKTIMQSPGG